MVTKSPLASAVSTTFPPLGAVFVSNAAETAGQRGRPVVLSTPADELPPVLARPLTTAPKPALEHLGDTPLKAFGARLERRFKEKVEIRP
jgi:hypothetical protein